MGYSFRLGDVFSLIGGGTPSTKNREYWGSGTPWISSADIDLAGNVSFSKFVTDKGISESATNRVSSGTVIVVTRVGLGKVCICPTEMCFSQDMQALSLKDSDTELSESFLLYQLKYLMSREKFRGQGTTISGITKKHLADLILRIPPLEEQRRIVSRIEELFSELDNCVSTLQKTKEQLAVYRQAVLRDAFSAETHEMKKTCEIGEVCLGRQRSPKNVSKNYPTKYIRAANITEAGLALDDILEMEFTPVERKKYYLQKGDIVISEASGSATQVGKPAVWNGEIENCCFQNTVIRLRLNEDLPEYVFWYLKFLYSSGAIAKVVGGVGINHLGANKFSNIEIPIPDEREQKRIVSEIESRLSVCDQIESTVNTALQQAEAMRQSILKQAFEGSL